MQIINRPAAARPKIYAFLRALRKDEAKALPVGVAGFCWGGRFVTDLCMDEEKGETRVSQAEEKV